MMSQMKALEDENRQLKRILADLSMQADLLKEALGKKSSAASSTPRVGRESGGNDGGQHSASLPHVRRQRDLFFQALATPRLRTGWGVFVGRALAVP